MTSKSSDSQKEKDLKRSTLRDKLTRVVILIRNSMPVSKDPAAIADVQKGGLDLAPLIYHSLRILDSHNVSSVGLHEFFWEAMQPNWLNLDLPKEIKILILAKIAKTVTDESTTTGLKFSYVDPIRAFVRA